MVLTLLNIAELLANKGAADRNQIYVGKMQSKREKSIGVYNLSRQQSKREVIGGDANSSYKTKQVSLLVHWDRSSEAAETAADRIYRLVSSLRNENVDEREILFTRMLTENPVDVGTDDSGVYEMVIEVEFYYNGKDGKSEIEV